MLFACSGIPLPHGRAKLVLTRFATSARLAREYIRQTYRDDKLKVGAANCFYLILLCSFKQNLAILCDAVHLLSI
jgi:hypothetical protein